ncbi:hypothetical protein JKP88DRAFT_172453 [Tribonema minus]|uniref:Uncharacterized protein n=1 Tax=Tribonema minus TaxID=303371 RepID=A0A835YQF0_9STRA|nr:hypothetical protein JKP88DRAFT_172453 [Tribonema minus]
MCALATCAAVQAQWDGGLNPREDEYFGARMRQGQGRNLYQEPAKGPGVLPYLGGILGGFLVDRHLTKRAAKKLAKGYDADRKALEAKLVRIRDDEITKRLKILTNLEVQVQDAELRIEELQQAAVDAGMDLGETQTEVDYAEFKQPDANNDDRITRAEFSAYIAEYLKQYPHLRREDMPRFEDFDFTGDGIVEFKEWQKYLDRQRKEDAAAAAAEAKKQAAGGSAQYNINQQRR